MSEPAVANFSGHIEFAQPFDIDQTANVIDTILVPALQRLGFDDDKLWTVSITGLENNPAAEAKVIAALEAEAAAIEAERKAAPPNPPQIKKPQRRRFDRARAIAQAEKATGRPAQTITLPDGTKLDFGTPAPVEPESPWPLDEFRTKETKQ